MVLDSGKACRDKMLHIGLPAMLESQLQENENLKSASKLKRRVVKMIKELKVWEAVVPAP